MTNPAKSPKGGRPTPAAAGLILIHRDAVWERLSALPEGGIFRPETVLDGLPDDARDDFQTALGYDHVHVADGWHTAIRELSYVRMLPNPIKVAQAWCQQHGLGEPIEFGDWTAHRDGMYRWEPLAGYRFRVTSPRTDTVLALGHMRIRIQGGAPWLMGQDPVDRAIRAFTDMPHKTLRQDMRGWLDGNEERRARVANAIAHLDGLDAQWENDPSVAKGDRPSAVARIVREAIA